MIETNMSLNECIDNSLYKSQFSSGDGGYSMLCKVLESSEESIEDFDEYDDFMNIVIC
jgi:hypothetical protein